jgi:hypothetical protein
MVIESHTLSGAEILAMQINLVFAPVDAENIVGWVDGGSTFLSTIDFTITGTLLDFSISGYAPLFSEGDILQFIYKKSP